MLHWLCGHDHQSCNICQWFSFVDLIVSALVWTLISLTHVLKCPLQWSLKWLRYSYIYTCVNACISWQLGMCEPTWRTITFGSRYSSYLTEYLQLLGSSWAPVFKSQTDRNLWYLFYTFFMSALYLDGWLSGLYLLHLISWYTNLKYLLFSGHNDKRRTPPEKGQ